MAQSSTLLSPDVVDTSLLQDGQPAGSITPSDIRQMNDSLAGLVCTQQSGSYTFGSGNADYGTMVEYTGAGAGTFTIPLNAYAVGTIIWFRQAGAGQLTIAITATGTLHSPRAATTRVQWSAGYVHQRLTNEWVIFGDMT